LKYWLAILFCALTAPLFAQPSTGESTAHFRVVDIYVDSGSTPLAAYQLKFSVTNSIVKIVGIEGGQHRAFREPPFYDPKAMQEERVVIAAFSTEKPENLPTGKTRVATIHLQTTGTERLGVRLELQTAADSTGKKISATATCEEKKAP
jgi:hypothetical protein